jgi:hypothetical protein
MPYNGMTVADVALTKNEHVSSVGWATLKVISKLSYVNAVWSIWTSFLMLQLISLEIDVTMLYMVEGLMDSPACAMTSMTFSRTQVDFMKKPIQPCKRLHCLFVLCSHMLIVTTAF